MVQWLLQVLLMSYEHLNYQFELSYFYFELLNFQFMKLSYFYFELPAIAILADLNTHC